VTREEQRVAARQFAALMQRVRAASARASRGAIRKVDAALAEASVRFAKAAAGTQVMTKADAARLLTALERALADVETAWIAATKDAQAEILSAIVREHKAVNFSVAKVARVDAGGIALRLSTVPVETKALMKQLRKGSTIDAMIKDNMSTAEQAMADYIRSAVGEMPSAGAVRGIRRLLAGQLPVDLGGMTKADVKAGASIPWRAERVIITESFEGYRQGNALALTKAVVQMVAKWQTAGDNVVCPVCLGIARHDSGHGPGWYRPDQWPRNPHPHCRCGQGEIRILT
jgi:ABC-type transporter Mla MlaB component